MRLLPALPVLFMLPGDSIAAFSSTGN